MHPDFRAFQFCKSHLYFIIITLCGVSHTFRGSIQIELEKQKQILKLKL